MNEVTLPFDSTGPAVVSFVVPGEPLSKARARFTKYGSKVHTYTPRNTLEAEGRVLAAFIRAMPRWGVDAESGFGVLAEFYAATRQRRDVDNMIKLALDALNKHVWLDDSQVTEVSGRKHFDPSSARSEITIYRTILPENGTCDACGGPTSKKEYARCVICVRAKRFPISLSDPHATT